MGRSGGLGGAVDASVEAAVAPGSGIEGIRRAGGAVGRAVASGAGVACSVGRWVTAVVSAGAGDSPAGSPCSPLQAARDRRTVNRIAARNTFAVGLAGLPAILPSDLIPSPSSHLGKDYVLSPQACQRTLLMGAFLDSRHVGCSGSRYPAPSGVGDGSWGPRRADCLPFNHQEQAGRNFNPIGRPGSTGPPRPGLPPDDPCSVPAAWSFSTGPRSSGPVAPRRLPSGPGQCQRDRTFQSACCSVPAFQEGGWLETALFPAMAVN